MADVNLDVDFGVIYRIGTGDAKHTGYDNTESGLEATNVQDAIDEVNAKIENIPSVDAYTKEETDNKLDSKVSKLLKPSYNLFDGSILPIDGNIGTSGFTPAQYYKTTAPIYLDAGSYYYTIKFATFGTGSSRYAKTNQQGTSYTVLNATETAYTITMSGTEYTIYAFTVSEAGYYAFNLGNAITARDFMLVNQEGGVPDHYVPYQERTEFEDGVSLNDELKSEVLELHGVNPLFKKKLSADGDSICWGKSYLGGFAKLISEKNEMGYQNIAVAGATLTAEQFIDGSPRHWVCRSVQNLATDSDYIIVEGGVNDSSLGVTLGAITNGYTATLDDTTFYGAVESICKTLTTKYVGKKYGFVIPHRMSPGMYPNGNYNNAIVECGIKWGVPVLDLSKTVPPFNSFRDTTEYDNIRNEYTTNGDGWHPTEICYRQYYVPQIEAWLKTL